MVCMNIGARRGPSRLWGGFEGHILAGSLTLLDIAYQLLPEDHTDLVEVKAQQKVDSPASSYKGIRLHRPLATLTYGAAGASLEIDVGSLREMGIFYITLVLRSLPPSAAPETVPNPLAQMMTAARNTASAVYWPRDYPAGSYC